MSRHQHEWVLNHEWNGGPSEYPIVQCIRCNEVAPSPHRETIEAIRRSAVRAGFRVGRSVKAITVGASLPYADGSRWFAGLLDTVEGAIRDIPETVPTDCWCDLGDSFVRDGKCVGCGDEGPHGDICRAPSWRPISPKELRAAVLAEIEKLR